MPSTPDYAIPYPAPGVAPDVPYDLQQLAERVAVVLKGHDHRLGGAQGVPLILPMGAGIDGQTPGATVTPLVRSGYSAAQTVAAGGVLTVVFPTPFPNGLHAVVAMTAQGTAIPVVLNGSGTNNKTQFQLVTQAAVGTTGVRLLYVAVGW